MFNTYKTFLHEHMDYNWRKTLIPLITQTHTHSRSFMATTLCYSLLKPNHITSTKPKLTVPLFSYSNNNNNNNFFTLNVPKSHKFPTFINTNACSSKYHPILIITKPSTKPQEPTHFNLKNLVQNWWRSSSSSYSFDKKIVLRHFFVTNKGPNNNTLASTLLYGLLVLIIWFVTLGQRAALAASYGHMGGGTSSSSGSSYSSSSSSSYSYSSSYSSPYSYSSSSYSPRKVVEYKCCGTCDCKKKGKKETCCRICNCDQHGGTKTHSLCCVTCDCREEGKKESCCFQCRCKENAAIGGTLFVTLATALLVWGFYSFSTGGGIERSNDNKDVMKSVFMLQVIW